MESIQEFILNCREHSVYRYVLSAPAKDAVYEKTVISRIDGKYQIVEEKQGSSAWSKAVFMADRSYIDWADVVVMLYHGQYSDSGTAWECGYAFATHTPVLVVHLGRDSNLMVHEGSHANLTMEELKTYDFDRMPLQGYTGSMF